MERSETGGDARSEPATVLASPGRFAFGRKLAITLVLLSLVVAGAGLFAYYTVERLDAPVGAFGGLTLPAVATLSGFLFLLGGSLLLLSGPVRSAEVFSLLRCIAFAAWGIGAVGALVWLVLEGGGGGRALGSPDAWGRVAKWCSRAAVLLGLVGFDYSASGWLRRHRILCLNGAALLLGVVLAAALGEGVMRVVFHPPVYRPLWVESPIPGCEFRVMPHLDGPCPTVWVRTNSEGLRTHEIAPRKTRKRVLTLGDSVTFGAYVEEDESFTSLLQKRLAPEQYEVINGGQLGYQLAQILAFFRHRGRLMQPDIVIYTFNYDDIQDPLVPDGKGYIRRASGRQYGGRWARRDRFRFFPLPQWLVRHSYLLQAIMIRYFAYREGRGVSGDADLLPQLQAERWDWLEANLVELRDAVERAGARFLFVVFPLGLSTQSIDRIVDLARRNGIEVINMREVLGDAGTYVEKYMCAWDSHPNAAAHARMAEAMYERLISAGFVRPARDPGGAMSNGTGPPGDNGRTVEPPAQE